LALGKQKRAHRMETEYLRTTDLHTDDVVSKLTLNTDDNQFFVNTVLMDPAERAIVPQHLNLRESNLRLQKAVEVVDKHLHDITEQFRPENREAILADWVKFIDQRANIVVVHVADQASAFRVFETLNDRGLRASQADILKNYFFSKAQNRLDETSMRWSSITGAIESIGDDDLLVLYIRHYWVTLHGPTKERELADAIRDRIKGQQGTMDFLRQLDEGAADYVALFNPDHSKWNKYKGSVRSNVRVMTNDLKLEQIRPLMFAIARYFHADEAEKAFRLCVNWSVRFLIVGGRGALLDRQYSDRAHEIGTGRICKASELAEAMRDYVPNDATFEQEFARARVTQSYLARYYLKALDHALTGEAEPERVANPETEVVNLEHVMPRVPSQEWNVDAETALACERRLGNMVLLRAKRNVELGNAGFAKKKKVFEESGFEITREVIQYDNWGLNEINERQAKLAQLAVKAWPVDLKK
jgi:hypothetical protein